uniref:Uncharacterized protein n=1 Tax=Arundo donax TaxID=35708 RepID=A0A0A9ACG2_ARUDO
MLLPLLYPVTILLHEHHYRTILLPLLYPVTQAPLQNIEEFQLILNRN